jgi:photosystem II stability/assembly factor-like uncharacterized protein
MSERALVATRKGLFSLDRNAKGKWDLSLIGFGGDPVTMILTDAGRGRIYAALNLGHFGVKLHRSDDNGKTWTEASVPAYPEESDKDKAKSLVQIWCLEHDGNGGLWAGTIPGGLFHSPDGGDSWTLNEPLWNKPERPGWFGGGYDDPGLHSVCVDPNDENKVTVGVSCGGVWVSEDRGASWAVKTKGMFAEYMPDDRREDPGIQDPHRVVQSPTNPSVMWAQHHNGVFRTTNYAEHWDDLCDNAKPAKFGFAVAVHPAEPDTAWFVPAIKDECRIPVNGQVVVSRTRDGGKTFEVLREGLPQEHAYDLMFRHALDVDTTGDRLLMGSSTGSLWISENQGDAWHLLNAHLPPIYAIRFDK